MQTVNQDLLDAILGGTTHVTRRVEIYEKDGSTLWLPSADVPRAIDGSISVDYGRDERRSLDLTLDNKDGVLRHDPDGFWYDKIIKTYRGVRYTRPERLPRVALLWDDTGDLLPLFRTFGYTNVDTFPQYTGTDPNLYPYLSAVKGYDIVAAGVTSAGSSVYGGILALVYDSGTNVFSYGDKLGNYQATYTAPWHGAVTTVGSPVSSPFIAKTLGDNRFRAGWSAWTDSHSISGDLLTGITNRTKSLASYLIGGATLAHVVVTYADDDDTRWFHNGFKGSYHGSINVQLANLVSIGLDWIEAKDKEYQWETQTGEFMIDDISEDHFPSHLKITGRDYTKKLLSAKFAQATSFPQGVSLDATVKTIATNAGIRKFKLGSGGIPIQALATFDRTTSRWEGLKGLCDSHNVEIFFTPDGYLATRPFRDPVLSPAGLTLSTDPIRGNLVSYNKKSSSTRIYNQVVVTGDNQDDASNGIIYQGIAENHNPASPTSIENLGQIITYFYTSSFYTSSAQCQATAEAMLKIKSLEDFQLGFSSVLFPWLEAGEVVDFQDPKPGVDEPTRFLLISFELPMALGPMSANAKRVTIIGAANTPVDQGDEEAA
jgi:hypothetical protein